MSLHLYELTDHYLKALDYLTDPENEIDQQTAVDTIDSLDGELDDKLLNVGRVIANIEAAAEAIKQAEKRQYDRRKSLENKASWLRDYLLVNMKETGHAKVACDEISLTLAKTPAAVQIDDETVIPKEFFVTKIEESINKKAIAEAIKSGEEIPGASLKTGFRVSIK